jgi:hypothetical protein
LDEDSRGYHQQAKRPHEKVLTDKLAIGKIVRWHPDKIPAP